MKTLRGITWDHPRGFDSILASSNLFMSAHPGIQIEWSKRSLEAFGYQPISELVKEFDLLMIDHPFIGEAHTSKLFRPLEEVVSPSFLDEQSGSHIGPCYSSYSWQGLQYALPVDASAQFSAYSGNLIEKKDIPESWEDYLDQMKYSKFRQKVLWPLCPTDLWCSLLTVCAQILKGKLLFTEAGINSGVFSQGLDALRRYTSDLNKHCFQCNPIMALDLLSAQEYFYSPLLFGYCNYPRVSFRNALSLDPKSPISLLGGVGLSVSSFSENLDEIAEFIYFLVERSSMDTYFQAGGQPSLRSYWLSDQSNRRTNDFFRSTLPSMENAWTRPRHAGFHRFQEQASLLLHEEFLSSSDSSLVQKIGSMYYESIER